MREGQELGGGPFHLVCRAQEHHVHDVDHVLGARKAKHANGRARARSRARAQSWTMSTGRKIKIMDKLAKNARAQSAGRKNKIMDRLRSEEQKAANTSPKPF